MRTSASVLAGLFILIPLQLALAGQRPAHKGAAAAAEAATLARYDNTPDIPLPFPRAGIGPASIHREVTISYSRNTHCGHAWSSPRVRLNLSSSLDVLDRATVNRLYVIGVEFAEARCPASNSIWNYLKVELWQKSHLAMRISTEARRQNGFAYYPSNVDNHLARRLAQEEKARRTAEAWSNFWKTVKVVFIFAALVPVGIYHRRILSWLHYLFVPHPAEAIIRRAQEGTPLADEFYEAMHQRPSSSMGFENMRRKAEELAKEVNQEAEYFRAQEKLIRAAEERERTGARVNAHNRYQGKR